jgi:hypothetical protein
VCILVLPVPLFLLSLGILDDAYPLSSQANELPPITAATPVSRVELRLTLPHTPPLPTAAFERHDIGASEMQWWYWNCPVAMYFTQWCDPDDLDDPGSAYNP